MGGYSCCAGISQRGFVLPPPWLASPSTARGCCESPTSNSLPPLPASEGDFGGPQQRRFQGAQEAPLTSTLPPPLGFPDGPDDTEAASCPNPLFQSPEHHSHAQEPRDKSNQTCHNPAAARAQRCPARAHGRWHPSTMVAVALLRGAGGVHCLRAFLLYTPALLCDFGRVTFCSKSRVPRPWALRQCQQSWELAALPFPVGTGLCTRRHTHGSVQSVGGGGF